MGETSSTLEMSLSLEALVRHEAGKLLREGPPGRFLCLSCLEQGRRSASRAAHTKGRVERALKMLSRTPGDLTYKHAFVCDQCGKNAPCLSAK